MKLRRSIALTALAGVMLLGGCSMGFNDPALLHPPKTTGREAEIQRLLDETAKNNYVLKYPKSGAFRSAIITQDINHDGKDEAVAFYSDGNSPVNVLIMYDNKGWKISKSFSTDFPEVDCVQFADYDTDGTDEILAGFVTDGGQNELRVFDLDAKTNDTTAIDFSAEYSGFTTGDYDRDGSAEIMLMKLQSTDSDAEAILVDFDGRKLFPLSVCKMDSTVTKLEKTTSGMISEDTTGVVADGITESGYNTQVLYYSATKAALVNFPLTTSKKPNPTSRSFSVMSEDIDDDGFIEVPVISPDNITAESEETAPVISWSKLSTKSNKLIEDIQCVGNYDFGYYFTLPEGFAGLTAATVSKDRRTLTICAAQDGELGEKLLTFRVIDVGENVPDDFSTIESYNQYTYTYKINNADYIYIDEEIIKENFALNDSGA